MEIHSEDKEVATSHYKGGFGFHPMSASSTPPAKPSPASFVPATGADQLAVVDNATAQLPAAWQAGHRPGEGAESVGHPLLVRADTAGAVRGFIDGLVARNSEFSVGGRVSGPLDAAIAAVGEKAWVPAREGNGMLRRGAHVVELDVTLA